MPCHASSYPSLLSSTQIRALEASLASQLPPYTLMARAGEATARLALAMAPHARRIWVACGTGNNGGDGLEAAIHLHAAGKAVHLSMLPTGGKSLPADAAQALQRAQAAGLACHDDAPADYDLIIDALWGIGLRADLQLAPGDRAAQWLQQIYHTDRDVLCIDTPSGLQADTGALLPAVANLAPAAPRGRRVTLTMLGLKPGLLTHQGTDWAGEVWLAPLSSGSNAINFDSAKRTSCAPAAQNTINADLGALITHPISHAQARNSHKGLFGDVGVIGGQATSANGQGMEGAAMLAASAALHAGAGRVMLHLLGSESLSTRPSGVAADIMLRSLPAILALRDSLVCGCGGGSLVTQVLPQILNHPGHLVLDADALNAIAADTALRQTLAERAQQQRTTVITPHPLELARLLNTSTAAIQSNRIAAAQQAAHALQCVVVLKGSGTVMAAPDGRYAINHSGNARLSIGGTGDVLAGCMGAQLAALSADAGLDAIWQPVLNAVWMHGHAADTWPAQQTLTATRLAEAMQRVSEIKL